MGWIGVDLDGTLAVHHDDWDGIFIGEPVPLMVERVKRWLAEGIEVRIVTARVAQHHNIPLKARASRFSAEAHAEAIEAWCLEHIGTLLPVTNEKDYSMIELWDDRAVQVIPNTGRRADGRD